MFGPGGCLLAAAVLLLGGAGPAFGQVVSSTFNGVNVPIRVEFWSEADGVFDWYAPDQRRATGTWTADQIASVERGVGYWWEVLGAQNTPGRTITLRMIRTGEQYDAGLGTWRTSSTHSSSSSLLAGGDFQNSTNNVWAFGGAAAPSQVVDSIINFDRTETGFARNGPIQVQAGVNLEITTIHELGHTLGITGGIGSWGTVGEPLTLYESQVVSIDANGNRIPVVAGETFSASDMYYFNGLNARAVYGDTVYGELGRAVPLAESEQKCHLGIDAFTMTHESFRNYPFFAEVELAVLQDLGYQIDRRRFFGRSIYTDGGAGISAIENLDGFNSDATYGVGLHLKASDRVVVQRADLIASGVAGNGIRIDGNNNEVIVDGSVNIKTDGEYGVGLLVSNGKNNRVVHRGSISAASTTPGSAGTGIYFGFGFDTMGPDEGDNRTSATESKYSGDYLVDRADISGEIHAGGNAIHIDHTAAVKEINVLAGAQLTGDIVSDALVGTSRNFDRPMITFGRQADADGVATDEADADFHLEYAGNVGGQTLMDAQFVGGVEDATGTLLTGSVVFNSAEIFKQGRVTANGVFVAADTIEVEGVLQSTDGVIGALNSVIIHDGGRLAGTPTIVAPLVENRSGGTMFAGNSIGTMAIVGDFQSSGTLQFDVTHQTLPQDASRYDVFTGTATINANVPYAQRGTFEFNAEDPSNPELYAIGRRYTILTTDAPGMLQIEARPQVTDNLDGRRFILRSDVDQVAFYTPGAQYYFAYVGRDASYEALAKTANQRSIGGYLDDLFTLDDGSPFGDQVQWFRDSLDLVADDQAALLVLNQMTGELYASVAPMMVQQSYLMQMRLAGQLRDDSARLAPCDENGEPIGVGLGGWITGFGTGGGTGSDGNAAGYSYGAGGTQVVVTRALSCETTVGGYYNFTAAGLSTDSLGSVSAQANEFGVLLAHHTELDHFLLLAGGGGVDLDVQRIGPGAATNGGPHGSFANVYGEYGLRFGDDDLIVRPFAGLGYVLYAQDRFTENGSSLGSLTIDALTIDSLRSLVGLDMGLQLDELGATRLDTRVAWMHDYVSDGGATVLSSFAGAPGPGFVVQGAGIGRDFAVVGASLSHRLRGDSVRLFGGYDLIANDRQALNSGSGGIEASW